MTTTGTEVKSHRTDWADLGGLLAKRFGPIRWVMAVLIASLAITPSEHKLSPSLDV